MKAAVNSVVPLPTRTPLKTAAGVASVVGAGLVLVQLVLAAPPTADFSISNSTPRVDQEVTFTSTVTDADNDVTEIAWDFDYDGTTFTANATGASASTSYGTPGTRSVALRVTDGTTNDTTNHQVLVTKTVAVTNPPPTAAFTISPNPANAGQTVTFNGSTSSDPQGPIADADHDWDLDGNGSFETPGTIVTRSYASGGNRTITLRVTDAHGATDLATHTLTVNNAAPTAAFTISPNPANAAQTVTFDGSSSRDPEGAIADADHDWDLDGNGTFESTGRVVTRSYPTGGARTIAMRVVDSNGVADRETKTLIVNNAVPTAAFTISPNPASAGQMVTFDGSSSSDPEGPIPDANHDWDLDGDGRFESTGKVVRRAYTAPGPKTIRLQVTDANGASSVTAHTLTVANAAPTARFTISHANTIFTNLVAEVGETVTFDGSGSTDPDVPIAEANHDWDLDNDGQFDDAQGKTVTRSFDTAGVKTVRLRVTDSAGVTNVATNTVRINGLPVAVVSHRLISPRTGQAPLVPLVGQEVEFVGSASIDPNGPGAADDGTSTLRYAWDLDGDGSFERNTDSAPTIRNSFSTAGIKTVRLRVSDSDGAQSTAGVVTFRVNTPPAIAPGGPGFSFSPETPIINQPIEFTSRFTDPDALDQLRYAWDLDGNGSFETDTGTNPRLTHPFPTVGSKTVGLRVTDTGGIAVVATSQVLVRPSVPQGDFVFSPDPPLPGQPVTFTSSSSPSVGPPVGKQILKREWDFDYDQATFSVDAEGASVGHTFSSAGPRAVALRITEGMPNSPPDTHGLRLVVHTVTVNAPPQASFSTSSASPFIGDAVTFSSTAKDPDGPLASQAWDTDNDGQFDDVAGAVAARAFPAAGVQTVRLRVVDSKGASAVAVGRVDVRTRPIPPPPPPPPLRALAADVDIQGRFTRKWTRITRLIVHAPMGARVGQRCKGRGCPRGLKRLRMKQRTLRLRAFERRLRPGARITIPVTMPGFIGTNTQFTIRRGMKPKRVERCLQPGAKRPSACPPS
jgi:PKD repeat protein